MRKKLLVNLFLLISVSVFAGRNSEKVYQHSESKTEVKSFALNESANVEIINKYGDIIINTWEKDSVRFEVTITAEAQKLSQVKTLIDMAEIKFTANNAMVTASLEWGGNVNAFKKSAVEMTLATGTVQMLRVNYTVYMPTENTLKVENRFGNVVLPEMKGKVYIDLNHGDFKAQKIHQLKSATVKYGDVDIENLKSGDLDVSFGNIFIENGSLLFIRSGSGSVEIENAEELDIEARNSKIRIDNVTELKGTIFFGDLRIKKLVKKLQVNSNLSDIDVRSVDKDFTSVVIDAAAGDLSLNFATGAAFKFDINLEKSKTFTSDKSFVIEDDDKMENYRQLEGKVNNGTEEKLNIKAKNCNVSIAVSD